MYLKIVYLILFLGISVALSSITWIPSFTLDRIVEILLFVLTVMMLYLVYKLIKEIHYKLGKVYSVKINYLLTTLFALIFIGSTLFVMFINILTLKPMFAGELIEKYTFGNKTFYLYDTGFLFDIQTEVSMKMDYLPIRKIIKVLPISGAKIVQGKVILYCIGDKKKYKIYDFKESENEY